MPAPSQQSLPEVHASVATAHPSLWRRVFAFAGPAYLVSVGYMDPGNWATDLEGGARFGYRLLWVLVLSNAMAILLQTLSARLGIVAGRDLAQACREQYSKPVSWMLWVLCEIAIAACDLAEVLGAAIGLNLLFGLPLIWGVVLTAADTLLILWLNRYGIRVLESIILGFVTVIGACFLLQVWLAKPEWGGVASGLVPWIDGNSLYVAIAMLGATVMPHNLYLHSSLVQTRRIGASTAEKKTACRYNLVDSVIALNAALLVNGAILIVAAATFYRNGVMVTEIQQAHKMLAPLLGTTMASVAFALALLFAGQSSTITGTMAGQIVMEGFLNFRMRPWLRRLITRLVAVIPAVLTISYLGESATYQLLIFSQVILSLQLPFAVIPLIQFTSDRARMGSFANPPWVKVLSWSVAALILSLNAWLVVQEVSDMSRTRPWVGWIGWPLAVGLLALLARIVFARREAAPAPGPVVPPEAAPEVPAAPQYRKILVTLDHTGADAAAVAHAVTLARGYRARVLLLHVEEGVTSQVYGEEASTAEVEAGAAYFTDWLRRVRAEGVEADLVVVHGRDPKKEIIRAARALEADLLVMGAHGHRGIKDLVYGATINEVRHALDAPVLVVRETRHPE
ncbi:MAG: Nramp family divalent metal transporter [Solibacteraceae bacterium]|nr:Nramp family divalent metal transporter [Solibacteraceae bacterium]